MGQREKKHTGDRHDDHNVKVILVFVQEHAGYFSKTCHVAASVSFLEKK